MRFLYPEFREKALTFSYDDGCCQDKRLTELFRKYGVRATFNLNSAFLGWKGPITHGGFTVPFDRSEPEEIGELYRGFEVASHNATHYNMSKHTPETIREELWRDTNALRTLTGQAVRGFAYPCGGFNHHSHEFLAEAGIAYARTGLSTFRFDLPQNFYYWCPTCHDRHPDLPELARRFVGGEPEELWLLYIWGHSFELDKDDIDRWENLENHLRLLSGREDVWYAENIEICDYITACRACIYDGQTLHNPTEREIFFIHRGKKHRLAPGKTAEF